MNDINLFLYRENSDRYLVVRMISGDGQCTDELIPRAWTLSSSECYFPKGRRMGCSLEQLVKEALPIQKKSSFKKCEIDVIFTDGEQLNL